MKNACIKVIITLFLILINAPGYSYTLKGEVTYTVERARKEAFSNVEYSLPKSIIKKNLKDPNFKENIKAIKLGTTELKDRYVSYFADGEYQIVYKKDLFYEYYYNQNGILTNIGKRVSLKMPTKCYKYDTNGMLICIILYFSEKYTFTFLPDGQIYSYWINDIEYDQNGKILGKRL